ncbi:MAG: hypothetical protein IT460_17170 [Planctomycetes bacterium]|nr:hypothetical protein [Planctomycetota bacterium]
MLTAFACLCTWTSQAPRLVHAEPPPSPDRVVERPDSPKTWVFEHHHHHHLWWWIWSDVRAYLGDTEWKSIDLSWMPARARADLARARSDLGKTHAKWDYADSCLVGGLWRLGLEREAALELLSEHDGDAAWPLSTPDKRPRFLMDGREYLWRPRLERWYGAQPADGAAKLLRAKLAETWREAVASRDAGLAATAMQAMDERIGREVADELAPEALGLIRETLSGIEEKLRARRMYVCSYDLPIDLMERFGVPEQVDLTPFVDGTRRRVAELSGEPVPLPYPYDVDLLILRLGRLQARRR